MQMHWTLLSPLRSTLHPNPRDSQAQLGKIESVWLNFVGSRRIPDPSAPSLEELERKLRTFDRALAYLSAVRLGPGEPDGPIVSPAALLERATDAFLSVGIDGDGVPDQPRARTAVNDAWSALSAFLQRKRTSNEEGADVVIPE